jgi:hypothetical protein
VYINTTTIRNATTTTSRTQPPTILSCENMLSIGGQIRIEENTTTTSLCNTKIRAHSLLTLPHENQNPLIRTESGIKKQSLSYHSLIIHISSS